MDPLTELKSLLNIPEGMTAEEANVRGENERFRYLASHIGSRKETLHADLRNVWWAISDVLQYSSSA